MLKNIKSKYNIKYVFTFISKKLELKFALHNKKLQNILQLSLDDYKKCSYQIEIELIPNQNKSKKENIFINLNENNSFYFNNSNKEIDRNFIEDYENISKIRIIIDMGIKSLCKLFCNCTVLKEIKFIKFNRIDFLDMSKMFYFCNNLINLDISKLKTNNVKNMLQKVSH